MFEVPRCIYVAHSKNSHLVANDTSRRYIIPTQELTASANRASIVVYPLEFIGRKDDPAGLGFKTDMSGRVSFVPIVMTSSVSLIYNNFEPFSCFASLVLCSAAFGHSLGHIAFAWWKWNIRRHEELVLLESY